MLQINGSVRSTLSAEDSMTGLSRELCTRLLFSKSEQGKASDPETSTQQIL